MKQYYGLSQLMLLLNWFERVPQNINMCVSKVCEQSCRKIKSGSASIPNSPPATLHCRGDHHPSHCILTSLLFNALLCILILSFCHFVKTLFKKHGKNVAEGCLSFGLTF